MIRPYVCLGHLKLTMFALVVVALVAMQPKCCLAGPLSSTNEAFAGTPNGVVGHDAGYWRGHDSLVLYGYDGLSVDVDFAVFAPGPSFGQFLSDDFGTSDPTDGTNFVYAFQVKTLTNDNGFGFFTPGGVINLFTGFDPGKYVDIVEQSFVVGTGIAPLPSSDLNDSSAQFDWAGIDATDTSAIVYYTSPYAPKKDGVNVNSVNGDATQSGIADYVSPSNVIPEPSTLALLAGGVAIAFARRRRFRY